MTSHATIRFHGISRLDGGKLDGIHLLWSSPFPTGHSVDGYTIFRRRARGKDAQHCFEITAAQLSEARASGLVALPNATVWGTVHNLGDEKRSSLCSYRIELKKRHSIVTVTAPLAKAAFIGSADGAVMGGEAFTSSSVTLSGSDIAVTWVISSNTKDTILLCGDVPQERDWQNETPIVEGLQVPFSSVNPTVSSHIDGLDLAKSRANPENLVGEFKEVSLFANAALSRPGGIPAMRVLSLKYGDSGKDLDMSPYGLALAPTLLAPWRRAWGLSHLDQKGLTPGEAYDYHIVGTVPRRDRDEAEFDLHTVPRGYRLPHHFRWGTALVWSDQPPVVREFKTTDGDVVTFQKGFDTKRLTLVLDKITPRVIINALRGSNALARGYRNNSMVGTLSASTDSRTVLDFGADVDKVVIEGSFSVAGIIPLPLDPSLDPDEPVEISQTIYNVRYVPTSLPDAPASVTVTNLSDPARTATRGVHDTNRGFSIQWDAPSAINPAIQAYQPESTSASPTEVSHYILERAWSGSSFGPSQGDGLQVSGRNVSTATDTPGWGVDILAAFPPANAPSSSHSEVVTAIEVFEPNILAYCDDITYRVHSVDVIGRLSSPTTSAPTPLRKFVRPPPPTTPPASDSVDPREVPVSGVQVALYQLDDPDLTADQRTTADGSDSVVIRWGWGPDQRALDPDVTEFRIYYHGAPLTALDFNPTGLPSFTRSGWSLPVTVNRPVTGNEFAGLNVTLGASYRIIGHGIGSAITLILAPNAVDRTRAPTPVPFILNRTTSAELNSDYWDHRVMVVARTPEGGNVVESYSEILPADWIVTSDTMPLQRVAYGVTAADAEAYVPDRRETLESSPRPGNESTIAATEITARYYGRPSLTPANLADVTDITLDRHAGETSRGVLTPADYAPAGGGLSPRMLLERLPASAVLRRLRIEESAISLVAANGSAQNWTLSSADERSLRDGYDAGLVPDRFLAHAATRLDGLEEAAERLGIVDPSLPFEDDIPNRPSRWVYRLRSVNAMDRPSEESQLLGVVLHVPSPSRANAPKLAGVRIESGNAIVDLEEVVGDAFVFLATDASLGSTTASLATIRNRSDLAPDARIVVRDSAGRTLSAIAATPAASDKATATAPLPPGGPVLHVWALSVSSDGVPSRLVGPIHSDAMEA